MGKNAADFRPITSAKEARKHVAAHKGWHHAFEIYPGVMTPGSHDPHHLLHHLKLGDVKGRRILDVGASNGYFSRELHRMGAMVVALDYRDRKDSGFALMERCYGRQIQHVQGNVCDLGTLGLGHFDIALFLGVLYHLPDPVRALWNLRQICDVLYLETYVEVFDDKPAARYYHSGTLNQDITNFWAPNPSCVEAMVWDAGMKTTSDEIIGDRIILRAEVDASRPAEKLSLAYGLPGSAKA